MTREKIEVKEPTCQCDDLPITFCRKCESFFVITKDGSHEEIDLPKN